MSTVRAGAASDRTVEGPPVEVVDIPAARVHHQSDLLGVVIVTLGAVLVVVLAAYAHNTTGGIAEDVQGFATLLRRILFVPVNALVSLVTVVVPLAVLIDLAVRRQGRLLLETTAAAATGLALTTFGHWALTTFAGPELVATMSVTQDSASGVPQQVLTLPGYVAMLAALLTLAGPRAHRSSVRWSWNALWVSIGVTLITAQVSLPGVALALLLGRFAGLGVRYLAGVAPERAYGDALVAGILRAGYTPVSLVRVPDADTRIAAEQLHREHNLPIPDPATAALVRSSDARVYQVRTAYDEVLDLRVLDGDRQVVGLLARTWRSLRLRGIEGRNVVSLRQASERAALLAYAATAAGVHTPRLLRISENADSMMLLQEHPADAVPLGEVPDDELTDELLAEVWTQLRTAHHAGIAHRAITADTVLVGPGDGRRPRVWLTVWDSGDVASSELARRIDITQMLAVLALRIGADRAVRSVADALDDDDVAAIGPMLQTIAMPRQTRDLMRTHKDVLAELRQQIVARLPEASIVPQRLVRFGARTALTIVVTLVALFVVLTTINVHQIGEALRQSDWRFSITAYVLGLATLVGAALTLVAFSPVRLNLWRVTVVQAAASFVALAAPAGIGPAALNLRTLTKRGVSTTLATATVALIQVAQLVVTVVLLVVLTLTSGTQQQSPVPLSPSVLAVIGIVVVAIASALLVPQVRAWAGKRVMPTLRQTWPRLVEVVGQPGRLMLGLSGSLVTTLGYVLAFDASLRGLGQHVSLVQVAIVYLAGTTLGSLVPTPGGVGTVEAALAAGLGTVAGVNPGVAFSVAVLFRVLTYWLRIPLGWVAMRYLQRAGEL